MIRPGIAHPICLTLVILLAAPSGFAQTAPASNPVAPAAASPAAPKAPGTSLSIDILEGNNVINSLPLLRAVTPVIEVKDSNDFPVEDAAVTFTLPAQGPGGNFVQGGKTYSTRSDARGQAIAPIFVPVGAGKFQINVTATAGDRKGAAVINQTNSEGMYAGQPLPKTPWYKKKLIWAAVGGAVAAIVVVVVVTHKSASTAVVITPGPPVFQ